MAGAVSLILGRAIELGIVNPNTWAGLTWADMYHILKAGARDQISHQPGQTGDLDDAVGKDSHYGWGLIDIDASIEYLEDNYPCSNPPC